MLRTRKGYSISFLLAVPFLFAGPALSLDKISVYASLLPQKYLVERVGGSHVAITVMVGPGQSPATYEPTPRQMAGLSNARIYFRIGVPFENVWIDRIAATNPRMKLVDSREGVDLKPMESAAGAGSRNTQEAAPALDPHIWTTPSNVKIISRRIRDALSEISPDLRADFARQYEQFAAELDALDREVRAMLAPFKGKEFLVFHPSWGYFAREYGLRQIAIESEGKEPGPKGLARTIEHARGRGIKAILVQKQFSARDAMTVARAIGGEVITVDPLAEDFTRNTRSVASALARTLQ